MFSELNCQRCQLPKFKMREIFWGLELLYIVLPVISYVAYLHIPTIASNNHRTVLKILKFSTHITHFFILIFFKNAGDFRKMQESRRSRKMYKSPTKCESWHVCNSSSYICMARGNALLSKMVYPKRVKMTNISLSR